MQHIPELNLISLNKIHPLPGYNCIRTNFAILPQRGSLTFTFPISVCNCSCFGKYWRAELPEKPYAVGLNNILELLNRTFPCSLFIFMTMETSLNFCNQLNSNVISTPSCSEKVLFHPTHPFPLYSVELTGPISPSVNRPVPSYNIPFLTTPL